MGVTSTRRDAAGRISGALEVFVATASSAGHGRGLDACMRGQDPGSEASEAEPWISELTYLTEELRRELDAAPYRLLQSPV